MHKNGIILLGAPGSGKGTIASRLSVSLNLPHISTGDMFRSEIKQKTDLGILVTEYIKKGALVPDELTLALVDKRFSEPDVSNGFLLDGFPRTLFQANGLKKILLAKKNIISKSIVLEVEDDVILQRIVNRQVCENCKKIYHKINMPTKISGICDDCSGKVVTRKDDTEEIVQDRLKTYYKQTAPLISFYEKDDKVMTHYIDASNSIDFIMKTVIGLF